MYSDYDNTVLVTLMFIVSPIQTLLLAFADMLAIVLIVVGGSIFGPNALIILGYQ